MCVYPISVTVATKVSMTKIDLMSNTNEVLGRPNPLWQQWHF